MYAKSQTSEPSKTNTNQAHSAARNVSPVSRNPSPANLIQLAVYDPAQLSYQDLMMLQRTIGNRAVGRLFETHGASGGGVMQRAADGTEETEKNRPLPNRTGLSDNLKAEVENLSLSNMIQCKRTLSDVKKTNHDYSEPESAEGNYNKSLESGRKLLKKGLDWYLKKPEATKEISTESTHKSIIAAGYKTFWTVNGSIFEIVTERGKRVHGKTSGKVDSFGDVFEEFEDLGTDVMYGNKFNAATGEFTAEGNWGDFDDKVAQQDQLCPKLPNSEIIWHQQDLALKAYERESGKSGVSTKLATIKRSAISNKQTLDTLLFCDRWPEAEAGGKVTIDSPFNDDVWALLGSPNGNSSVHILMQHGEQFGGVDLQSVAYETSGEGAPPAMTITYMKE